MPGFLVEVWGSRPHIAGIAMPNGIFPPGFSGQA